MNTLTEESIKMREELRKSEIRYWQKIHPNAKVELKDDEIHITYPLPKDLLAMSDLVKKLWI